MEFLQSIFESTEWPLISAFILGLMTAISPCPLATNVTAIAFISKDIEDKKKVFINGLVYTLGRAISYTSIGILIYFTAGQIEVSGFFQQYGEKILGPLLILIGLFILDLIRIKIPGIGKLNQSMEKTGRKGYWGALLMGIVFALAFCPYSGVLYFAILIPMTVASVSGLYLPVIFAIGTGIPVIIFAWLIAFTLHEVGSFYDKIKTFEKWFRRIVALVFIGVGIYYTLIIYLRIL